MNEIKKYLKRNLTCLPVKSERIPLSSNINEKRKKKFDFVIRTDKNDIVAVGEFIPKDNFEDRLKELNDFASKDFQYPVFLFDESKGEGISNWKLYSYDNINTFKAIVEPRLYYRVDQLARDLKRLCRDLKKQDELLLELYNNDRQIENLYNKLRKAETETKELKSKNSILAISSSEQSNVIYNTKIEIEKLENKILLYKKEDEERIRIEFRKCNFINELIKNTKNIYIPNEGEPGYMGWTSPQGKNEYINYHNGEWYFKKWTFKFNEELGTTMQGWSYFYKYNLNKQTFEKIELVSGLNIDTWIDFEEINK